MAATIALPRPLAAQPTARARLRLWPEWLILSLYTFVVAFAIPFHEPWADEAQAWQMARALSVHDLFFHALRYEGSPGLWHLLLHGLTRLHVSYAGMHWLTGLAAVCGMSLLIFFAPFPRWIRLTLPFTVFFVYQYAVVARSYVLVPLLAFSVAICWRRSKIAVAVLLGLLANTSMHGFGLAAALCIVYFVEMRRGLHPTKHIGAAIGISLALLGMALFTALPPPHDLTFAPDLINESFGLHLLGTIPLAVLYLLRAASYSWLLGAIIVPPMLWIIYRTAGVLYLLPVISVALLSGLSYWNYWHLGFGSIAVITTAWIIQRPVSIELRKLAIAVFVLWFIVQLSYSVYALTWDHEYPYSPDAAASQYLKHFVDQRLPLAVTIVNTSDAGEFHSVGLGPYFDQPIFINQPRLYWFWSNNEHTYPQFKAALNENPAAIVAMYRSHHGRPFDRSFDLNSRRLQMLYERGYGVTHVFCGARPEALTLHEQICEIVLER
ncbi:MAG TPA: hypothetical protein VGU68_16225 [Ktedonobacteraceae bacterium]|nr:hypothetical protein [Ktedonobacteraceae bacterium]